MSSNDVFLAASASIGRQIVSEAVWFRDACTWVARQDTQRPGERVYAALEPGVYDGTAGVSLFLAHLAASTGDARFRRTAAGAMRHAVARAPEIPPSRRDGFHAGSLGIAWAAARVGTLLDAEDLRAGARSVIATAAPDAAIGGRPDVVPGIAGSAIALLALADALEDPTLADAARATGERLLAGAAVTRHGWTWPNSDRRHRHQLCGLSHGAAGIGWALLELSAATGDQRFVAGARGAFEYERSWLDPRSGSWADLRLGGQRRGAARPLPSPAAGSWCHGAGGIALTRLRALELAAQEGCRLDAEVALAATRRELEAALLHETEDLTLCHGAAGTAEVLLCGTATLGQGSDAQLASDLGRLAVERHGTGDDGWPCGVADKAPPGLFRGLSGIGWWLLRLHDRSLPSPLTMPALG